MAGEAVETLESKAGSTIEEAKVQGGIKGPGVEQKRHNFLVEALRKLVRRKGPEAGESSGKPIVVPKEAGIPGFTKEAEAEAGVNEKVLVNTTEQVLEREKKTPVNLRDAMDTRLAEWHTFLNKIIIGKEKRREDDRDYVAKGETRQERIRRRLDVMLQSNPEFFPQEFLESANRAMARLRLVVKPK